MNQEAWLVLEAVLPLVCITLVGYVAAKCRLFDSRMLDGLSKFVFDFAVPLMFLQVFATAAAPAESPWLLFIAYYLPVYLVYGLSVLLARRGTFRAMLINGYTAASGNIVLVGLPVITRLLGDGAYLPFMIIASVHPLLMLTPTLLLMEMGDRTDRSWLGVVKAIVKGIAHNPMILAMAVGLCLNMSGVALPSFLDQTGQLMGAALTPCALFVLGAALASYRIGGHLNRALVLVAMKCLLLPALVGYLAFYQFDIAPLSAAVLVLMAAQPSALMAYVISARYQVGQGVIATAVLLSSITTVIVAIGLAYFFRVAGIGSLGLL